MTGKHAQLLDALPLFLLRCDADSTRVAYERELRRFLAWLGGKAPQVGTCERYVAYLRERGLSPTTVRWRATVASAFLRSACGQGNLSDDVTRDFKPPKGTGGFAPKVLTASQLRKLLRTPDRRSHRGRRDLAILVCLGVGGLRAGEVCGLSCGDVDWHSRRVTLRVNGKGRKLRLVPFASDAASALRAYKRVRRPVRGQPFFLSNRGLRLTIAGVDYLLRKNCERAGMDRINAHSLRHTAASLALEGGVPLHHVRDLLGHSSVLVTSKYLHMVTNDRRPIDLARF